MFRWSKFLSLWILYGSFHLEGSFWLMEMVPIIKWVNNIAICNVSGSHYFELCDIVFSKRLVYLILDCMNFWINYTALVYIAWLSLSVTFTEKLWSLDNYNFLACKLHLELCNISFFDLSEMTVAINLSLV